MSAADLYRDYSFGQLLGPLFDRKPEDLLPNTKAESQHHFLAHRHQIFASHYVTPRGLPTAPGADPLAPVTPSRCLLLHATGTGKTAASLSIMRPFLQIPGVSVCVLGFDNTKSAFEANAYKYPELGFVSQAEYAHLQHLQNNYFKNPTPLVRQELQTFTQRLKARLTNRGKKGGTVFLGYGEFASRAGFVDDNEKEKGEREPEPNHDFIDSFRGTLFVADEASNLWNTNGLNSRGRALVYALNRLGPHAHLVLLTATPMGNVPSEIIAVAEVLYAGTGNGGPPAQPSAPAPLAVTDYFQDERLTNETGLVKLFERHVSAVAASETHLYPARIWPPGSEPLKDASGRALSDFKFVKCQMPAYQIAALNERDEGGGAGASPDEMAEVGDRGETIASNSTYFLADFAFPKDAALLKASRPSLAGADPCITVNDLQQAYGRSSDADWDRMVSPEVLTATSGKYARFLKILPTLRGKTIIFHPRIRWGIELIQRIMNANGYLDATGVAETLPADNTPCAICGEPAKNHRKRAEALVVERTKDTRFGEGEEADKRGGSEDVTASDKRGGSGGAAAPPAPAHAYVPSRYVMMHGGIDPSHLKRARNQVNAIGNTYGADIQFVLGSRIMAMGYDFNAFENVVVLGFPDTYQMLIQLFGRAIRKLSHANLPPERRRVNIYLLVNMDGETTPERYIIKYPVYKTINQVMALLARIAVDRHLFLPYEEARREIKQAAGYDVSESSAPLSGASRYYAYGLFNDELANVYRVIKRLMLIRPLWKLDDFYAAVRAPPFSVHVDMQRVSVDTIKFVLQRILYRSADRVYLNTVKDFVRSNDATSALFNFDAESKFFIRSGQVCVLIWNAPFLMLEPVNVTSRSASEPLIVQQRFVQYRLNLLDTEVARLLAVSAPTYRIFHEYDTIAHNAAIRTLLEAPKPSNPALLDLYRGYGIVLSRAGEAPEYRQNGSGFRYARAAGTSGWISQSIERAPYADLIGFYEDKAFKVIHTGSMVGDATDSRTHERGTTCMNKSTGDLQELATELRLPAAVKSAARSTICRLIEEHLLDLQKTSGSRKTYVLFWGAP